MSWYVMDNKWKDDTANAKMVSIILQTVLNYAAQIQLVFLVSQQTCVTGKPSLQLGSSFDHLLIEGKESCSNRKCELLCGL